MKKDLEIKLNLEVKKIGINGEGIAYHNKKAVFIQGALPEEDVEVVVDKEYVTYIEAKLKKVLKKSPDRVEPFCPYYKDCGGCQTQHMSYASSLKHKRELVIEALKRYASVNPYSFEIRQPIGMQNPKNYRNKSSMPVGYTRNKAALGLYQTGTNNLVYIDSCPVQHDVINQVNQGVIKLVNQLGITTYDAKKKQGVLRYVVTRVAFETKEAQVTFILAEPSEKIFTLAKEVIKLDHVVSVYKDVNADPKSHEIFGKQLKRLEGKRALKETLGDFTFDLLPNAFFQLNPAQTVTLYDTVKRVAKLSGKEVVLDAYGGVGTIGMWLAKNAKEVYSIDHNEESIKSGIKSAANNHVTNIKYIHGDVLEQLPMLKEQGITFDLIVVDPPRTGLGEKLINSIREHKPKRFIYVSCNPSTLAKDINSLTQDYTIKSMDIVDLFPHTSHVETVVLLSLKTA